MLVNPLHLFYSRKGIPASASTRARSYLMAFPMKSLAKRVEPYMYEKAHFEITRELNVSHASAHASPMTDALNELGIDPRKYEFQYPYLDKPGYLSISKEPMEDIPTCHRIERSLVDILTYPFVKNVGIVFPLELVHEDDLVLVLESRLIEPDGRVDLFRRDLENAM